MEAPAWPAPRPRSGAAGLPPGHKTNGEDGSLRVPCWRCAGPRGRPGPDPPRPSETRRRPAARLPLAGPSCHRGRMFRHFFLAPRARGPRRKATVLGRKVRSARLSIDSEKENKKKTNMLATEGPFHSAESVLRRFNLRFTCVALSVFTGGHRGGSLEGSAARAESSWQGPQVPQQ